MEFSFIPALIAGFVATLVMSAMMAAARAANLTDMPGMPLFVGSMMSGEPDRARMAGLVIHYLVMGTLVFGLLYAWLFSILGSAGWLTGAIIGLVHGIVVGIMMPVMPSVHPRVTRQPVSVGEGSVRVVDGELEVSNPGAFGSNWSAMTPVGLVVGHIVYGVVLALVYSALI